MVLGERDASGRRRPIGTGEMIDIPADTVIAAVGEKVDTEFYQALGIHTDNYGKSFQIKKHWKQIYQVSMSLVTLI